MLSLSRSALGALLLLCLAFIPARAVAHPVKGVELASFTIYHKYVACALHGPAIDFVGPSGVPVSEMKGENTSEATRKKLSEWLQTVFVVQPDGQSVPLEVEAAYYYPSSGDGGSCEFALRFPTEQAAKTLVISAKFDPHTIVSVGGTQSTLPNGAPPTTFETKANLDSLWKNVQDFTWLGMEHLFTGFDHMLFIATLIFATQSLKTLIKLLTAFTVGHAITLIATTFDLFRAPPRLVDIGVAATIVYVAVENIIRKQEPSGRWWLVFVFGLIHGMGFSESLREMGLPENGLVLCLLSFNIGIELAQVIIAAVIYPILMRVRWMKQTMSGEEGLHQYQRLLNYGSGFTACMGVYWFVQRIMGNE